MQISNKKFIKRLYKCVDYNDWRVYLANCKKSGKKGALFEHLVKNIFQIFYSNRFKAVYLYNEIPNQIIKKIGLPINDMGVDILCIDQKGEYCFVQCKYRADRGTTSYRSISTFLAFMGLFDVKHYIFVTNSNKICSMLERGRKIECIYGKFWDQFAEKYELLRNKLIKQIDLSVLNKLKYKKRKGKGEDQGAKKEDIDNTIGSNIKKIYISSKESSEKTLSYLNVTLKRD